MSDSVKNAEKTRAAVGGPLIKITQKNLIPAPPLGTPESFRLLVDPFLSELDVREITKTAYRKGIITVSYTHLTLPTTPYV